MDQVQGLNVVIGAAFEPLLKAVRGIETKLQPVGDKLQSVGTSLSAALTAPLVGLGTLAGRSAVEFETAFAGVEKTVNGTADEIAGLRAGILDMTKTLPSSASSIAAVAESAGQLGIATGNVLKFTRTMIDLGETTNLSAEEAASSFARFDNITGGTQANFDRLGSSIVALGNNLATTEAEILQMSLRLAGAGATAGLTQANILGLGGALSSVGIAAEAGGTAFSKVIIDIASAVKSGGDQLENFARIAGVSASEFARLFKDDAPAAITAFVKGLGKIEASGGNLFATLDQIGFGEIRVRDALLRLAGASDLLKNSFDIASGGFQENTALADEAEKRYRTVASSLGLVTNAAQRLFIAIGDAGLLGAIGSTSEKLAGLLTRLSELPAPMLRVATIVAAVAAAIGPMALALGTLIKLLPLVLSGFTAVLSPIGLLGIAIAGAAAAIIVNFDKIKGALSNALPGAGAAAVAVFRTIQNTIETGFKRVLDAASGILSRLGDVFKRVLDSIAAYWRVWGGSIMDIVGTTLQVLAGIFSDAMEIILRVVSLALDILSGNWAGVVDGLKQISLAAFRGIARIITGALENMLTALAQVASFISDGLSAAILAARDKVRELRQAVDSLGAAGEKAAEKVAFEESAIKLGSAAGMAADLKTVLDSIGESDAFSGLGDSAESAGSQVDGLRARIEKLFSGGLLDTLRDRVGNLYVREQITDKKRSGIATPLPSTDELPKTIDPAEVDEANRYIAQQNELISAGADKYSLLKSTIGEGLKIAALDTFAAVSDGLGDVIFGFGKLKDKIVEVGDALKGIGKRLFSTLLNAGLTTALGAAVPGLGLSGNFLKNLGSGLGGGLFSSGARRLDSPVISGRDSSVRFESVEIDRGVLLRTTQRGQRSDTIRFGG